MPRDVSTDKQSCLERLEIQVSIQSGTLNATSGTQQG